MLGLDPFRHDLLRKYTVLFGTLFNDIQITRKDDDGVVQLIRVPLSHAPKDKILARVNADPKIDRQAATILPRMSYELTDVVYNADNKLRTIQVSGAAVTGNPSVLTSVLNPVSYDMKFTLWVFTKYIADGYQIIEQILPFFTPNFSMTADLIPDLMPPTDLHVRLDSATPTDVYSGAFTERRACMWTLEFTMTGYLYGPVRSHPIIKFANVNFYVPFTNTAAEGVGTIDPIDRVTAQPGLLANGSPTTNAAASIPYAQISEDADWGYAVTIYGSLVPGDIGGIEGE